MILMNKKRLIRVLLLVIVQCALAYIPFALRSRKALQLIKRFFVTTVVLNTTLGNPPNVRQTCVAISEDVLWLHFIHYLCEGGPLCYTTAIFQQYWESWKDTSGTLSRIKPMKALNINSHQLIAIC